MYIACSVNRHGWEYCLYRPGVKVRNKAICLGLYRKYIARWGTGHRSLKVQVLCLTRDHPDPPGSYMLTGSSLDVFSPINIFSLELPTHCNVTSWQQLQWDYSENLDFLFLFPSICYQKYPQKTDFHKTRMECTFHIFQYDFLRVAALQETSFRLIRWK